MKPSLKNEKFFNVVCPKSDKIISKLPIQQKKSVDEKFFLGNEAFKIWKELNLKTRIEELNKFKKFFLKNKEELIDRISEETSKTKLDILNEVFLTIQFIEEILKISKLKLSPRLEIFSKSKYKLFFEPLGVIGIISDANDSIYSILKPSILALISGNSVIVKPNHSNSISLFKILDFFQKAQIQAGIFQVITGDFSTTKLMVQTEFLSKIFYIGDKKSAQEISKICIEKFIPFQFELETKNIHIVKKTANLQRTSKAILHSAFFQCGQTNFNSRIVYVEKQILSEFIHNLKLEYELSFETDFQKEKHLSFILTKEKQKKFQEIVLDIKSKQGYFIKGGENSKSNSVSPCLLISANSKMLHLQSNETFPILTIFEYSNQDKLVEELNSSNLRSEISIWTKKEKSAFDLAKQLEYSSILFNESVFTNHQIFQSGFKNSSFLQGLDEFSFVRKKRIYMQKKFWKFENEIWWFPHSRRIYGYISKMMNFLFR